MSETVAEPPARGEAPPSRPAAPLPSSRGRWTVAAGLVLVVVALFGIVPALAHDFRTNQPRGDQTSHVYLALSFAYDSHTLNFDRHDAQRWRDLAWPQAPEPLALFFQRYSGGWAASKPYGYPLFIAPFVAVFGADGFGLGNGVLLLLLVVGSLALALRRFDALTAGLLVVAFYFASLIYTYAYPIMPELLEALLVLAAYGGAYAFHTRRKAGWAVFTIAVMAIGVVEKAAFVMLFTPLAALVLWELRARRRMLLAALVVGVLALGVSAAPYLRYSDGNSFTPYAGQRFQVKPVVTAQEPWDGGKLGRDYYPNAATEGGILHNAVSGKVLDRFESLAYYFVGRYTGMLVTAPLALLLLIALLVRLPAANRWAWAAVAGILLYIAFYIVIFPTNYYGGGQSVGNRYFVQIAPAVLVAALFAPLGARLVRGLAVAAVVLSAVFTLPHHRDPSHAYTNFLDTSAPQRLLPLEANQDYTYLFRGEPPPPP
jgi:4-amino-4-deoxy-L-arabinose transferase-like glycosyltransferase